MSITLARSSAITLATPCWVESGVDLPLRCVINQDRSITLFKGGIRYDVRASKVKQFATELAFLVHFGAGYAQVVPGLVVRVSTLRSLVNWLNAHYSVPQRFRERRRTLVARLFAMLGVSHA